MKGSRGQNREAPSACTRARARARAAAGPRAEPSGAGRWLGPDHSRPRRGRQHEHVQIDLHRGQWPAHGPNTAHRSARLVSPPGGPVDHLTLNAPTIAAAGAPFSITARAEGVYGNPASGYTGTVSFSSSDPDAFLPTPYTFTSADLGAKTLGRVILRATGTQTITVSDNGGPGDGGNPATGYYL